MPTCATNCDDGNICTIDSCVPLVSSCIHFNLCSPSGSQNGLSISTMGVSSAAPGSSFLQSVTITNNGNTTAAGLLQPSLIDTTNGTVASFSPTQPTQPAGTACIPLGTILVCYDTATFGIITLTPGQSKTFSISIDVPASAPCNSDVMYFAALVPISPDMTPIEKNVSVRVVCPASTTAPQSSAGPGCGNGNIDSGEQCDDANRTSGDGCSSACQFECTDSDGGNKPTVLGTVRSTWTRTPTNPLTVFTKTDTCQGTSLLEYTCSMTVPYVGAISTRMTPCANGCANGVCLP